MKPTVPRLRALMEPLGFAEHPSPGFVGCHRTHHDGRVQQVHFFWWSNSAVAAECGIPRPYLVVCPTLDAVAPTADDGGGQRFRIPLVQWPSTDQPYRQWSEVAGEFRDVFVPALDADLPTGRDTLAALGRRYILS